MTHNPKVSVIIPVYNREHLIQKSINSVLNQSYKNIEVIVIDDASTDETEKKVLDIKDDRLKYFKNDDNKGPSGSRNKGINLANGELIAFQDSDDEWLPEKLEKQVNTLVKASSATGAVYCRIVFVDYQTGKRKNENFQIISTRDSFTNGTQIWTPSNQTVLIKKSVLDDVGYFDERIKFGEDTELAIRVSKKYNYAFVDEPLIIVTRNHEQLTLDSTEFIRGREIIYEKHNDFLSPTILFNMCREISTYYILKNVIYKARFYLVNSFKHRFDLKTLILLVGIITMPFMIKYLYNKKYNGQIPVYIDSNIFT